MGNYLGAPKQFIKIDDEPIIYRLIRLLEENGVKDLVVVVPVDGRFPEVPCDREVTLHNECEIDRIYGSRHVMVSGGCNTFFFGDVYYTEEAVRTILQDKSDLKFFGRLEKNPRTGKDMPECFGVRTYGRSIIRYVEEIRRMYLSSPKLIRRCVVLDLYKLMLHMMDGKKPEEFDGLPFFFYTPRSEYFVEINDWTDDFDIPEQYDMFIKRWNAKNAELVVNM
jgi:hypothetical protein